MPNEANIGPTVEAHDGVAEVGELVEALRAATTEDGVTAFDHTPEELGVMVMESHPAVLSALTGTTQAAEIASLRERVRELEAGLRPFVDALEEMRFDRDHRGNPLPDSDTCGWIYVTLGDFRRARALLEPEAGK